MEYRELCKLLGIDEITDEKSVKRAYAKQVALHHPEEEPELFQQIQTAYHEASALMKQQNKLKLQKGQAEIENTYAVTMREDTAPEEAVERFSQEEFLTELFHSMEESNTMAVMALLDAQLTDELKEDEAFLHEITMRLSNVNILSYTMRKALIEAFDLRKENVAQKELWDFMQQDMAQYASYRMSCKKDADYLLEKWRLLCQNPEEDDSGEWISFLQQQNWNEEEPDLETIREIIKLERGKRHSHAKAVANKIYSFLRIKDHLNEDEDQTYESLKNILQKDAMKDDGYHIWLRSAISKAAAFNRFSSDAHKPDEWKKWLEEETPDTTDIEFLLLLEKMAVHQHYSKAVQNVLISYFQLETAEGYRQKELKKAIQTEPESYHKMQQKLVVIVIFILIVSAIMMLIRMEAEDYHKKELEKQERIREFSEEMIEDNNAKFREQFKGVLPDIEEENDNAD